MDHDTWWDRAACRGVDTDVFFTTSLSDQRRIIATYCRGCPVMLARRADATERERGIGAMFLYGVVGGETPPMRRKRRRAERRAGIDMADAQVG